jgi:hypothetical protein
MARWYAILSWCFLGTLLATVGVIAGEWPAWERLLVLGFAWYFFYSAWKAYRARTFVMHGPFGTEIARETRKERGPPSDST